ncbi:MAG: DUF6602 domain-containing protein [Hyphomonas sp.]
MSPSARKIAKFDLDKLMAGTIAQLQNDAKTFSKLVDHNAEQGRLNESHLVRVLRRYLPEKFGIGTGFVVSGGEQIQQSHQCDIIIFDRNNNTPFYASDSWQIYPIEMVYGVIEVKTFLGKRDLKSCFDHCAHLRKMCGNKTNPNKAYVRQASVVPNQPARYTPRKDYLPPRFFVFGYSGPNRANFIRNFKDLTVDGPPAHIHGICLLEQTSAVFANHKAFESDPLQRVRVLDGNGFQQFLMEMPKVLNSMLGVATLQQKEPGDPTAKDFAYRIEQFDMVDLDHYKGLNLENIGP